MPFLFQLDPRFIDFLIKKEKEDKKSEKSQDNGEYIQLPLPLPQNIPPKPQKMPKIKEKDDNDGVIVIDI